MSGSLAPELEQLDVFEPNPAAFEVLQMNLEHTSKARCFKLGIGPTGPADFFFTPGYSGLGSVLPNNARYRAVSKLESLPVDFVANIAAVTGCAEYDLVKLDVEGFEYEVIDAIQAVRFRYLYIEVTGNVKDKSHATSELLRARQRG